MSTEAEVTIDGVRLTDAQVTALRVAVSSHLMTLRDEGLGDDEHGRAMTARYLEHGGAVERLLVLGGNQPDRIAERRSK